MLLQPTGSMQLGSETRSSHTPRLSPRQPLEYFGKLDGPRVGSAWVGRAACIDWSESNIMNSITPDVVSPKLTTCLVDTNSTTPANQTGEEDGEAIKQEGGTALKHTYLDGVYG